MYNTCLLTVASFGDLTLKATVFSLLYKAEDRQRLTEVASRLELIIAYNA